MATKNPLYYPLLIILAGIVFFIPFLGSVHLFDWDEINFAESAREMIASGDYLNVQINFIPFWEKPPLFIWMQVLSMKIFGITEFAARFPNAIGGILTLVVLYYIGKKLYNEKFGLLWAFVYMGSLLPYLYFKSGIIDPWFNLFIFLGIWYMYRYALERDKEKIIDIILSAGFIGLGILTKGPVALLIFGLTTFIWVLIYKKWRVIFNFRFILLYLLVLSFTGGLWFILLIIKGHTSVIVDFINYQIRLFTQEDAGHGGFLLYHFVVLFVGVFPASVFTIRSFLKFNDDSLSRKYFRNWMMITFWVVLILFTIVNTKIVHYSSMCYFPLTYLATYVIYKIIRNEIPFSGWMKGTLIFLAGMIGLLVIAAQFFIKYKDRIIASGIIHDNFAVANLSAQVHWSGREFMIGVFLIIGIVFSLVFLKNNQSRIIGIFSTSLLFVFLTTASIVPKIEKYSQNAAIEFFEKIAGEDCYVLTWGYKSYAQYFYFRKPPPENPKSKDNEWLLTGKTDKPVYIVTKNIREASFREKYTDFTYLYEKNGFVFFVRRMKNDSTKCTE